MRAFVEDGRLHVVTQEFALRAHGKPIAEEETVFDERWTAHMRFAFLKELNESITAKPSSRAAEEDARRYMENLEEE